MIDNEYIMNNLDWYLWRSWEFDKVKHLLTVDDWNELTKSV